MVFFINKDILNDYIELLPYNLTLDQINAINVIIKADIQGSAEAVKGALEKIDVEGVKINVIRNQAGAITESDVILASASHAIIFGFNVRPDAIVRKKAEEEKVDIRLYRIIYALVEDMEKAMKGMLDPEFEEKVLGQAEVRKLFKFSKVGTIAGCMVTDGVVKNNAKTPHKARALFLANATIKKTIVNKTNNPNVPTTM